MNTVKFSRDYLVNGLGLPYDPNADLVNIVENQIVDHDRWSVSYKLIFSLKEDETFYLVYYSRGATELQEEEPWEFDKEVEVYKVNRVEKLVTVYE